MNETVRRHAEMIEEWEGRGHPRAACSGHTHPLPDCPAPDVHYDVFPEARPVRSPELLQGGQITAWRSLHGTGPLTDREADVFLRGRVREWSVLEERFRRVLPLQEYAGATHEELADWILTGTVPARVRRVWGLT